MIVPSIDIQSGNAVQLVGGEARAIDAGDPLPIARRMRVAGEIAVIDLDAAMGTGSNREVIREICRIAPCRVGGGIRDENAARRWLDDGARKIILGTAATPELLGRLPRARVIAAVDARRGEVMTHGWKTGSGASVAERVRALRGAAGGFLVTVIEREGRMTGADIAFARDIADMAADARVTYAGGVATAQEVADLDRAGIDAQVGMALYSGTLHLGDALSAPLVSDRADGLFPTVVAEENGAVLGMVYSSRESVRRAVDTGRGVYHSRKRGVWVKGATSGDAQELLRIELDCDRDALLFRVRQEGSGFCHRGTRTCFGEDRGLSRLVRRLEQRVQDAPEGSYTRRLLDDADLLRAKLIEEAGELADAVSPEDVAGEAADVMYFAAVAMARSGVSLAEVERVLDGRELRVTRRPGDRKD